MLKYILTLTCGFRGKITLSALMGVMRIITGFLFVALSKRAVDIATYRTDGNLQVCIIVLIGALIVELICSTIEYHTTELSEGAMKNVLQERLYARLLNSKWSGLETFHSGDMLARLTEDCRVAAECLCRIFPTIIVAIFQLTGAFIFLWYFSHTLAILLILILPLFILAGKAFFRKVKVLTRRIRSIESKLQEHMQESLQHRIILLAYRHTRYAVERISALHRMRYNLIRRRTNKTVFSRTALFAGFQTGYTVAFIWGVFGLRSGIITFGLMTAYLQLTGQIQRPIAELARLLPGLIQSHTSFSRIKDIENIPIETDTTESFQKRNGKPGGIIFQNVTFSYPEKDKPILNNFSHNFKPGSITAIIGETGVGKSTVFRLILALLTPQEGRIEIIREENGKPTLQEVSAATRNEIVYVPQGNSLISGTIRQNLRIGKPDASEKEMWKALHDAAADFVANLKQGLDTKCGEHGDGLSEGQAQRIAIARGLLKPGNILLLDEISASLDETTETLLMKRLTTTRSHHTILFVTHRKSVVPYCDTILHIGCKQ